MRILPSRYRFRRIETMTYEVSFASAPDMPFGILRRAPGNGWNLIDIRTARVLDTVYLSRDTAAGALAIETGAVEPKEA